MPRNDYDELLGEIHKRRRSIETSISILADRYGLIDCSPEAVQEYLKQLEEKRDAIKRRIKKQIDTIESNFASTIDKLAEE